MSDDHPTGDAASTESTATSPKPGPRGETGQTAEKPAAPGGDGQSTVEFDRTLGFDTERVLKVEISLKPEAIEEAVQNLQREQPEDRDS
jgi:hypothetical protein